MDSSASAATSADIAVNGHDAAPTFRVISAAAVSAFGTGAASTLTPVLSATASAGAGSGYAEATTRRVSLPTAAESILVKVLTGQHCKPADANTAAIDSVTQASQKGTLHALIFNW